MFTSVSRVGIHLRITLSSKINSFINSLRCCSSLYFYPNRRRDKFITSKTKQTTIELLNPAYDLISRMLSTVRRLSDTWRPWNKRLSSVDLKSETLKTSRCQKVNRLPGSVFVQVNLVHQVRVLIMQRSVIPNSVCFRPFLMVIFTLSISLKWFSGGVELWESNRVHCMSST